jgi:hypothetical protein
VAVFTTVLTADASTSDEIIHVADNDGARTTYPWRAVVEDEVMYVFAGVAEGLDWNVHRGADDTDPAEHPAGAILTGVRVGQFLTDEPLVTDDIIPAEVLTTEDETDWIRSDPDTAGV